MGKAISNCLKNYANFSGRSVRSEYWFFFLFTVLVNIVTMVADGMFGTKPLLYWIGILAFTIPSLAVGIRRMHDVGKTGWFILIPIYNIVLLASSGEKASNRFGEVLV